MNKSESIVELASALSKAQAEMPMVVFNATNPFFKSKYADLGAIIATSKPILAKHGLSVSQLVNGGETPSGNSYVGVITLLMHSSGEWIESSAILPLDTDMSEARAFADKNPGKYEPKFISDKNAAQEAGKTITYLRRYALSAILGMYADEDNDGEDSKPAKQSPKEKVEKAFTTPPKMLLETALKVEGGDGKPYSECSVAELEGKVIGCNLALKTEKVADKREQYTFKRDAAQTVLDSRSK